MAIIFFRTILLYLMIVFSVRLMGKRQIGELQPSELVITIIVSNIASMPIEEVDVPLLIGVLPVLMLVCLEVVMSALSLKSGKARRLLSGRPVIVIQRGEILQKNLRSLRFSVDDLLEELRIQGIFDPSEVWMAVVETNGKLSVYQRFADRPLTPEVAGISGAETDPPFVAVTDGELQLSMDTQTGTYEKKVESILRKEGLELSQVLLLAVQKKGKYYLVRKEKK